VAVVGGTKANQRGKKSTVRFGDLLAEQERLSAQPVLQPVEHREQLAKRLLIGGPGGRKSGTVDAVGDRTMDLLVQSIDLGRAFGGGRNRAPLAPAIPALAPITAALSPFAELLIRIAAGLLLVPRGTQKLFGWFGGYGIEATGSILFRQARPAGLLSVARWPH
jgi:hypothetical protein